jgi:hypothetical protein
MCDPTLAIAAAGLALSAGGTIYSAQQQAGYADRANKAEQDRQAASAAARAAENIRQKQFDEKAMANWQQQLTDQGPGAITNEIDAGQQAALQSADQVRTQSAIDMGVLPSQPASSVSDVFTKDLAAKTTTRMNEANKRIAALATLSGFDRANGYSRMTGQRFGAEQNLLGSQQRASLGLGMQEGSPTARAFIGSPSNLGQAISGVGNTALAFAPNATENLKSITTIFSPPATPTA